MIIGSVVRITVWYVVVMFKLTVMMVILGLKAINKQGHIYFLVIVSFKYH